ncbi:MAG TPA: FAD-binding oxidoreductase [Burkholderiaceae bacterium]|nr:FAD-binding oxidoreductase [Burkholderiaceae bacterium]
MNGHAIRRLRAGLQGALLLPGEPEYEQARSIWNGMTTRRPALIARVAATGDVIACVNFARDNGLPLSIRGGGHNVAGAALCDGGLTIDMSRRRNVSVDPGRQLVGAEAGATWGDIDRASNPSGLVVPGGIVSATGVAGLTLGGGFGWTSRKFGFAADNLVAADLITADGQLRHASANNNADLFWALRGAGGNFGAVVAFEFTAHRFGPHVLCGMVVYPFAQARAVIRRFSEVSAAAPDELCCVLILRHAPEAPWLPEELHGRPIAALAVCWAGDPVAGEQAVRPLQTVGKPVADTIALKSFLEHQTLFDAGQPFGRRYYWKSHHCAQINRALADALVEHAERLPSPHSAVLLTHLGGAPARHDPTINAVGARTAQYVLNIQAAWESPRDDVRHLEWAREYWVSTRPFSTGSVYVNFMTADEGEARVRAAYGEAIYERLGQIKARWDPGNLFCGAQNIAPR